jgi:hypothetical protein
VKQINQNGENSFDNSFNSSFNKTADILADYFLSPENSGIFGDDITLGMNTLPLAGADPQNIPLAMLLPLAGDIREITDNLKCPVYINMFMNV